MNTVISVYSEKAYKEYILSTENNLEKNIVLKKDLFGLTENVSLKL